MPNYVYRCTTCGKTEEISHKIAEVDEKYSCSMGHEMHRVPQPFLVNWSGPSPSQGEVSHHIKNHLENYERADK
jgi:putative FmdB family regulatory protein